MRTSVKIQSSALGHSALGHATVSLGLLAATLLTTGCGMHFASSPALPVSVSGQRLQGTVHGGQQPVAGATIQLYAANTAGYGSASYALLTTTVTTDGGGNFGITNDYSCPSSSSLVYIVATGGTPGGFGANPNLSLMTALGACGNLGPTTTISINELTTVASVYALSPFMSSYASVGTSPGNVQGLTNAFASVNLLVNTGNGGIPGPMLPANATVPTTELNTLGDILATCVNSSGGTSGDTTSCGALFKQATPPGGTAPVETIGAALDIARNPGNNAATLVQLPTATSPFQPTMTAATDLTVSIKYKAGGFSAPSAAALDANSNLWVTNAGNNTVSVLGPAGAAVTGSPYSGGGLSTPSAIAIDASGNAWVTDKGSSKLSVITPAGVATQTPVVGLSAPTGVAIDGMGLLWVTNGSSNSVTAVTASGTTVSSSTNYATGGTQAPVAVAINPH